MIAVVAALGVAAAVLLASRGAAARPERGLSRRFDPVFASECRGIPAAFLRALAKNESNFNPRDATGPAWGLLQVVEVVRSDYNRRRGTAVIREDLLDPRINARIACELLGRIAASYGRNHPRTVPPIDWSSPRFIGLLVLGWNSGWSEAAGVGYVIGELERRGVAPRVIDIDRVHAAALELPRASRFLRMPHRLTWTKRVVRDYVRELRAQQGTA